MTLHGKLWYTMASLFQSTMDYLGFHGISWYFTMVYHDLPWWGRGGLIIEKPLVQSIEYSDVIMDIIYIA